MKNSMRNRLVALLLAVVTVFGLGLPVQAASIGDGSKTCTVALGTRSSILETTAGTFLRAGDYTYTTNDGLSGPAYCIDHGLAYTDKVLPITGKYTASPATAGAFANGSPQHSIETFLGLYLDENAVLEGLTEAEYAYATQVAVWATLGQLGVDGTPYTAGREYLNPPTGDAQQARVFRTVQLILDAASKWDRIYQTGMYIRLDENALGGNISIDSTMTLEFAANNNQYGIKREVINGKSYYTREYIVASATSTYYSDYSIDLWADNAPAGTIFTDLDNVELARSNFRETATWRLPTEPHYELGSQINSNGYEYWGKAKLCIPVDTVTPSGEITINCGAYVMQYEIYLANNDEYSEQSYIIADPSKGTQVANAILSWGGDITEHGNLEVKKVGGGGIPLAQAVFDLDGTDGSHRTGTTNEQGIIRWEMLDPDITYTLTEKTPPAGFGVVGPITVRVKAAYTEYVTVKDDPLRTLTVRKLDKQNGYSLRGAAFAFEQIDGSYKTTAVTDHAGNIQFNADSLPIGSYKVYEIQAPDGYELDKTVQTVNWDGKRDVTLAFRDTRKPTLIISKQDSRTKYSLPGASFAVYKNGSLVTTVTTNDNGLAYVSGLTTGYYEVREVTAPEGYILNDKVYGVNIDPYDPATSDDPRLVIENDPMPSLRIVKYDRDTGKPLESATFKIYKDTTLFGTYTTDKAGEILLTGLEPGTYAVEEINAVTHVADAAPQQIELVAGRTDTATLVFFNSVKPGIHLIKLDSETLEPLAGAIFRVNAVGGSFDQEYTTGEDGEIDLSKLEPGTYQVQEVKAPSGYVVDDAIRTVQLKAGQNAEFVFTDSIKPGLKIVKTDSVSGKPVEGVTFTVKEADGHTITTEATDANGEVVLDGLTPGVLEIWEKTVPNTYLLNDEHQLVTLVPGRQATVHFQNSPKLSLRIIKYDRETGKPLVNTTFRVYRDAVLLGEYTTDEAGEILLTGLMPGTYLAQEIAAPDSYVVNSSPQQVELVEGRDEIVTLTFFNTLKPGIHLVKVDSQTMDLLAEATFRVTRVGGSFDQEYITDTSGEIDLSALEPGTYQIQEIKAPDGYAMDDAIRTVEVKAGQNALFVFTDSIKPSLHLVKRDEDGKPLEGATFRIAAVGDGSHVYDRTTDKNGEITITDLEPGVYSVTETIAPKNYALDGKEHHVELFPGKVSEIILTNTLKPSLRIVKYDRQSHKAMEGVTFEVFRDTTSLGKFQTNAEGEILLPYVEPGTYKAVEIDTGDDGHILTTTPQEIELHAGDGVRELAFFNDRLPGLHLIKVDSADLSIPIPNAKFCFTVVGGDYGPVELTTGEDGTIDLSKLPTGAYVVTELECPGYVVDDAQRMIHLDGNETAQFVFTNTKLPGLKLTKTGADGTPLEGVTFRIAYIQDGTHYMDRTTNAQGEIVIDGLAPGVLSIVETATLPNYILDPTEHHVELTEGKTATITLQNDRRPNLIIHKVDADTDEPVAGAVFVVEQPDGHSVAEVTTGQNGSVTVPNLLPGAYVVTEKSVPVPYLRDAEAQTVTLYANHDREVAFRNHKMPSLTVNKVDAITGDPIQGAKFHVTYASNKTDTGEINDLGDFYSDESGKFIITDLKAGWYRVEELEPAKGYTIKEPAVQEVYISGGESKVLIFENIPLSALVVWKYDSVTGAAVEGAVFSVRYLGGISGSGGTIIGTYKTSSNGSFTVTGLQAGAYIVEELASDSGHVIDTAPQTAYISGKDQDVVELYFGNSPKGSLLIKKVDSATGKPLSDVEFLVTTADGAVVGDANGKFTTDSSGSFTVSNITPGTTLVVKETRAKDGYILDDAPQTITVRAGQTASLEFRNAPMGALVITKRDANTNKPLRGAEFRVTTSDGTFVAAQGGAVSSNGLYTTDANGQIILTGLEPDTYVVTETKAPGGYELDATPQTVRVNTNDTQTLYFYNTPIPAGGLRIVKLDEETRQPISGVEFLVTRINGERLGIYRTNSRGVITLDELAPGWYTVTEVKAAEGYALDAQPHDIQVRDGQTATLELTNRPLGGLIIHKLDSVTNKPLAGVQFKITYADGKVVDNGKLSSNGLYTTDKVGQIVLSGITGTLIVTEVKTISGYTIDEETRSQTVEVNQDDTQTLTFYNTPVGAVEIVKVNAADKTERIPNTTFEIRKASDGGLVSTVTTDKRGRACLSLDKGMYYAVEVECPKEFKLDPTPHYFTVKDGKSTTLTVTNQAYSGIIIQKTDSVTGQGIYGVKFLVYDANKTPLGEYTSDNQGYVYIDDLITSGRGTLYIRELEAAPGYELDKEYKTVYVQPGKTIEVDWVNTPITGQIQVYKFAAEYNEITGAAAGTPLQGAVYEISDARSGAVVDYITTDARGIAASKPLPLTRYKIREVTAPAYWQVDGTVFDETLEYSGQIIKLSAYDKPAKLGVAITKQGNAEVLAGNQMRYDITVANTSNVPLESFFWHDRIPTDAATAMVLTTGTYSARLNYRILYKTNYTADYQVLASNLLTSNNYSFSLNAIPKQAGEVVTDVYFDFGKVPVGFQSVAKPTLTVLVSGTAANGYQLVNRADAGGKYRGTWQTAQASWVTVIRKLTTPSLPKTGY